MHSLLATLVLSLFGTLCYAQTIHPSLQSAVNSQLKYLDMGSIYFVDSDVKASVSSSKTEKEKSGSDFFKFQNQKFELNILSKYQNEKIEETIISWNTKLPASFSQTTARLHVNQSGQLRLLSVALGSFTQSSVWVSGKECLETSPNNYGPSDELIKRFAHLTVDDDINPMGSNLLQLVQSLCESLRNEGVKPQ